MNRNQQHGPVRDSRLFLLYKIFILISYSAVPDASAIVSERSNHVYIVYSPESQLHSNIARTISNELKLRRPSIVISDITPDKKIETVDSDTDMIIGIGGEGMKSANTNYPLVKKLFISTDPNKFKLDKKRNRNDAILYMTQDYCRQIRFIRKLNSQWKIISILNSREKPIDSREIQQCANEHNIKTYIVSTSGGDNITKKIKHALHHSDVLLALPDSNIYNSRTVKNILLTSYRYRKPVIAFSKNFVNAGALAAIYSDTEKIAVSASKLIEQYFYSATPIEQINYPDTFDISINKQVFRALDIAIPDIEAIKINLQQVETGASGDMK